jgi:aminomethyltransferase
MVAFAGWQMPIQYTSIVAEHHAVRRACGVFDVSHMGRIVFRGPQAVSHLRYLVTYNVNKIAPGRAHYALLCNHDGGIRDDIFIYRLAEHEFMVVVNAANAESDSEWMRAHPSPGGAATIEDRQQETVMLALQGPDAARYLDNLLPGVAARLSTQLKARHCVLVPWSNEEMLVARTGYTGEDGFELITSNTAGIALWERLTEAGVQPCGLGARDTLRLEAALVLYGNDIDQTTNPYEAGLGWVVSLDDGVQFIGREALLAIQEQGPYRRLVCLRTEAAGIPRAGCPIIHNGQVVGRVTSGGPSPTLGVGIAMGYVPSALAEIGTTVEIDVRGRLLPASIVQRPFYRRESFRG